MSVALTADAVIERRKTVTRRDGWWYLKPGDRLTLCRKVQGRRKGEPLDRLAVVEVVSKRREQLFEITPEDVAAEGFPDWTPEQFIDFYINSVRGAYPRMWLTRIEWRYLDGEG
jgi:hypothetical protein